MSKIIFFKIKKYYFNIFQSKKHFKKQPQPHSNKKKWFLQQHVNFYRIKLVFRIKMDGVFLLKKKLFKNISKYFSLSLHYHIKTLKKLWSHPFFTCNKLIKTCNEKQNKNTTESNPFFAFINTFNLLRDIYTERVAQNRNW